jgi:NAD(P)-dependent dehydrogenase (short-subunit alcohol dehydrogenase family)
VQWQATDVAQGSSVARLIETIMSKHGRLDYAFNNGGSGGRSAPVSNMTESAWRKTIDGFLTSAFLCMNAEIPAMQKSACRRDRQQRIGGWLCAAIRFRAAPPIRPPSTVSSA